MRYYLARCHRRTHCYTKSLIMLEASIAAPTAIPSP
ncbi:MAG: IS1 family transposase [Bacteroidetes bacterium]|nr:IS1 family transposase [Bacteroidota bacterium]